MRRTTAHIIIALDNIANWYLAIRPRYLVAVVAFGLVVCWFLVAQADTEMPQVRHHEFVPPPEAYEGKCHPDVDPSGSVHGVYGVCSKREMSTILCRGECARKADLIELWQENQALRAQVSGLARAEERRKR